MSEAVSRRAPSETIEEVVKTFIRMNRTRLADDGELLALLLPDRFKDSPVGDLQRFVIDRLSAEITALKKERPAPRSGLNDDLRRYLLDLIDARSFSEAITVALSAAPAFGGDLASICIEGEGASNTSTDGVRLIPTGTVAAVLGEQASGAILSNGGELLLGTGGDKCRSLAAFRLRIGRDTPAALYVVGARKDGCFEGAALESDLRFFARALERTIRAWLDLPKI